MIRLTRELIDSCRSDRGEFTNETARILGAEIPLTKGWPAKLVGREIDEATWNAAKANRNRHPSGQPWILRSPGQMGFEGLQ